MGNSRKEEKKTVIYFLWLEVREKKRERERRSNG
jgi:hypothetical protein